MPPPDEPHRTDPATRVVGAPHAVAVVVGEVGADLQRQRHDARRERPPGALTSTSPATQAVPTSTGTTAAGSVRGRAPATHDRHPDGTGAGSGAVMAAESHPRSPYAATHAAPGGPRRRGRAVRRRDCSGRGRTATPCSPSTPGSPARPAHALLAAARARRARRGRRRARRRHQRQHRRPKLVVLTHAAVEASARATSDAPRRRPGRATAGSPACRLPTSAGCRWSPGRWSPAPLHRARRASTPPRSMQAAADGLHAHVARADRARPDRPGGLPHDPRRRAGAARRPTRQRHRHLRPHRDRQRHRLRRRPARRRGDPGRRTARSTCAAPMLLRAYRDGDDPKDDDGWLPTGDAGSFDGRPPDGARPRRRPDHHRRRERVAGGGRAGAAPPTPAWPRWSWSAAPTRSGASGSWRSSCPPTRRRPRRSDDLRDHVKETLPAYAAPEGASSSSSRCPAPPAGRCAGAR